MLPVRIFLAFALTICVNPFTFGQSRPDTMSDSLASSWSSQFASFGNNKQVSEDYKPQVLFALSHFPELKDLKVSFKMTTNNHNIISTRPTFLSLFRRKANRRYIVFLTDSVAGRTIPAFSKAPVNGQVGILGHEFCHIVYFNQRNGIALFGLLLGHLSKSYMDRFERNTDIADIHRGLGPQLIVWKLYLRKRFGRTSDSQPPPRNSKMRSRYLTPEEVQEVMKSL